MNIRIMYCVLYICIQVLTVHVISAVLLEYQLLYGNTVDIMARLEQNQ